MRTFGLQHENEGGDLSKLLHLLRIDWLEVVADQNQLKGQNGDDEHCARPTIQFEHGCGVCILCRV